ncbi:MAG: integrase arm-type DNA-binding domain-containing protein [Patescibacteria group bacterium]|nr:integrase arm-type DNA-binding domain-containing protein [Patescibacteria group bacterium]
MVCRCTDRKVSGLVLRVTKTGVKTFSFLYRMPDSDVKRRLSIGKYPVISLAEARGVALEASNKVLKGVDPAQEKQQAKATPSFKAYVEEYRSKHLVKLRTAEEQYRILTRDAVPAWGGRKITRITQQDAFKLLEGIRNGQNRKSPIAANRLLERLRHLFNVAKSEGVIEKSPMEGSKKTKEVSRNRVLENTEIKKFWQGVDACGLSPQLPLL